jgi:hypothetical protein
MTNDFFFFFLLWDYNWSTLKRNWEKTLPFCQFSLCWVYFTFSTEYINSFVIRRGASFQNGPPSRVTLSLLFFWCLAISPIHPIESGNSPSKSFHCEKKGIMCSSSSRKMNEVVNQIFFACALMLNWANI